MWHAAGTLSITKNNNVVLCVQYFIRQGRLRNPKISRESLLKSFLQP